MVVTTDYNKNMSIYKPEHWHSQIDIAVVSPADILAAVSAVRRSYVHDFMQLASGRQTVRLAMLPGDLRASRQNVLQSTQAAADWFNSYAGNDVLVDGAYESSTQIVLGSQGMVERVVSAPSWAENDVARAPFRGIGTIAGASLREAGLFIQDCVVELHTYPRPGEPQTRTLAMPLAAMVSMDFPSSSINR